MRLTKQLLEEKKQKALEMVGKRVDIQIAHKAISIDEKNKTAVFVMSTSNIDRHGDIVDQDSWILKYFEQNPAFFLQHRSDNFPLGRWLKVWFEADPDNVGERRMVGEAYFATDIDEDAARAWAHVVDGNLNMVSVGFIPHRIEYDEERDAFILYDCELLECSLVGIGSNRQALVKEIENDEEEDVRDIVIKAKEVLDAQIKASDNSCIIAHLKAREDLNAVIRRLKIR